LIFVHGLNRSGKTTHPFDDWTHENGTFWPQELLPDEIPNARIQIFGYNANVENNPNLMSEAVLKDHASSLLNQIDLGKNWDTVSGRLFMRVTKMLNML
jgi:hypothetical protein